MAVPAARPDPLAEHRPGQRRDHQGRRERDGERLVELKVFEGAEVQERGGEQQGRAADLQARPAGAQQARAGHRVEHQQGQHKGADITGPGHLEDVEMAAEILGRRVDAGEAGDRSAHQRDAGEAQPSCPQRLGGRGGDRQGHGHRHQRRIEVAAGRVGRMAATRSGSGGSGHRGSFVVGPDLRAICGPFGDTLTAPRMGPMRAAVAVGRYGSRRALKGRGRARSRASGAGSARRRTTGPRRWRCRPPTTAASAANMRGTLSR